MKSLEGSLRSFRLEQRGWLATEGRQSPGGFGDGDDAGGVAAEERDGVGAAAVSGGDDGAAAAGDGGVVAAACDRSRVRLVSEDVGCCCCDGEVGRHDHHRVDRLHGHLIALEEDHRLLECENEG